MARYKHLLILSILLLAGSDPVVAALPSGSNSERHEDAVAVRGKAIFFDASLSADGKTSCATCHRPDHAFAGDASVTPGVFGRQGTRNAPTLLGLVNNAPLFWDGRRIVMGEAVLDPFVNPVEMGLRDQKELMQRVRASPSLRGHDALSINDVAQSLAAYLASLSAPQTRFERMGHGRESRIELAKAQYGQALFTGKAGCAQCHNADAPVPLYTDHGFHASGTGLARVVPGMPTLLRRTASTSKDPTAIGALVATDKDAATLGRFLVTRIGSDVGRFRTPSLRYVADTSPYMHDGSIQTLEEAVDQEIYWRGLSSGRPVILTVSERDAIVAFLRTLTTGPTVKPAERRASSH